MGRIFALYGVQTSSRRPVVSDIMSKKVVTAYADSNVTTAIRLMVEKNIGSIVVIDNEGPYGIFSERDLLRNVLGKQKSPDSQILMEVTPRTFSEIEEDQTLGQAARQMISKRSRLTVFEGDELVGIVTASGIVRAIYENDLRFYVGDCVRKKVVVVDPETTVEAAIQIMNSRRIGSVLVGEGEELGIFTERDMLKRLIAKRSSMKSPVQKFVSAPLITASIGIGAYEVSELMMKNKIKRLPLKKAGKIAGILTARDIVRGCAARIK